MMPQPNATGRQALAGDMIKGIKQIAEVCGLSERQAYHLASHGMLPGVFRIGRAYFGRLSVIEEETRRRARGEGAA